MIFHFRNLTSERVSKAIFLKVLKTAVRYKPQLKDFEISLVLIDNRKMRDLNRKYLGTDKVTDVLSFKLSNALAEIFLSVPRAKEQAKNIGQSLKRELATLFIHGLLHILGYDHKTAKQRLKMFKLQDKILKD